MDLRVYGELQPNKRHIGGREYSERSKVATIG